MRREAGLRQIVRHRDWLEQSQWWAPERLRAWQGKQLARLVQHARKNVPYYAERLRGLGTTGEGPLKVQWRDIPRLTKAQVRTHAAALRTRAPQAGLHKRSSSGSTGHPLTIVKDLSPRLALWAIKLRAFAWFDTDFRGSAVSLKALDADIAPGAVWRADGWGTPVSDLHASGRWCSADIFLPLERQLELIEAEQPQYLITYPSNLRLLLRLLRNADRRLPSLRYVQTLGEQVDADLREECRAVLGVPLHDVYGAMEADFIAVQCPGRAHYHVQSELNFVEVLREDGRACASGEIGRVVITPLYAHAMPLLRYDLEDFAEVGPPCPCGRGLPVLKRILGRRQGQLTLPSGERRFSVWGSRVFAAVPVVTQYQIAQTAPGEIELRMVAARPLQDAERAHILSAIGKQLGPGFNVTLKLVEEIPRLRGGKLMEFVSELKE